MSKYQTFAILRPSAAGASFATVFAVFFAAHATVAETSSLPLENLPKAPARHVDFASDIKPLLAKNCFHCHGPDAQEAGLRLDTRKFAFKGADSGPVIV